MAKYGIPYMGSKSGIAENLIAHLPKGERFVDLFGGGFAMSECAIKSDKFKNIYYNDIVLILCELIKKAINGYYNYNRFKPRFISREEFDEKKEHDGYIKYIWSFGNNGKNYLFSQEIELLKKSAHNYVVFNIKDETIKQKFGDVDLYVTETDIRKRRLQWRNYLNMKRASRRWKDLQQLERLQLLQQLQQLERLQQLEQLQQLERLERLEINCGSYLDYEHKDGDVVYCDPPYEGTADYGIAFNHQQFYDWCASRPYEVFFSSYKISDKRFKMVYAKGKVNLLGGGKNQFKNYECLYSNKG